MKPIDSAHVMYEAFAKSDAQTLFGMLHPEFHGRVSEGLSELFGGPDISNPDEMRRVWGQVAMTLPIRPIPTEVVQLDDDRVLGIGFYEGGGIRAAFAHLATFEDGKLKSMVQITDSALWLQLAESRKQA